MARILVAHPKLVVRTAGQAQAALAAERFAVAVLGVYFDESRMFDVMSFARGSAPNRDTAIVCVLGVRGGLSRATLRMLDETVAAIPRCEFLNLAAIPDDPLGNAVALKRLERRMAPPGPPPAAPQPTVARP